MIYIETAANLQDVIFPMYDGESGYKFIATDNGEHTFKKSFTIKKEGTYEIDFIDIDVPPEGVIKTITITVTK